MREYCPIIEYKLCVEGKKIYKKLLRICDGYYKNIQKINLEKKEYDILLKAIPFHSRDSYKDAFKINGKLIVRGD